MYMIMLVLDQSDLLDDVLHAWEEAGITGATIAESFGLFRRVKRKRFTATRYVLPTVSDTVEKGNFTLFSIVAGEEQVQAALQATEKVTGDLDLPNTGVFSAWPLAMVKGVSARVNGGDGG